MSYSNITREFLNAAVRRKADPDMDHGLVGAVIDAAAHTSGCYLGLLTGDGEELHRCGTPPPGAMPSFAIDTADGSALRIEGPLDPEQLQAVAQLVQQAMATSHELAETKTDLGRSQQELSLLHEFSKNVCRVTSLEDVVDRFLFDIVEVLEAREGTFLGLDEERQELSIVCHHGSDLRTIKGFRLPLGEGIAGKVAQDGHPRLINDTSSCPEYVPNVNPINNIICVPIRLGGKIAGVVSVNDRRGGEPFEPSHLRLLASLTQLGEVGLENARLYEQVRGLLFEAVDGLVNMMEAQAPNTVGHSRRVARLSFSLGRSMGLKAFDLERLYLAALVHDLGAAPEHDEAEPAPWSSVVGIEEESVAADGLRAAGIIDATGRMTEALPGFNEHQEHFDGNGHPQGLTGDDISLQGRIIAVADSFDSAVHTPRFQRGHTPTEALEQVAAGAGTRFDPAVVKGFEAVFQELRLASWVPPIEDDEPWNSADETPRR